MKDVFTIEEPVLELDKFLLEHSYPPLQEVDSDLSRYGPKYSVYMLHPDTDHIEFFLNMLIYFGKITEGELYASFVKGNMTLAKVMFYKKSKYIFKCTILLIPEESEEV